MRVTSVKTKTKKRLHIGLLVVTLLLAVMGIGALVNFVMLPDGSQTAQVFASMLFGLCLGPPFAIWLSYIMDKYTRY